jgi:hypothetical protein
MNKVNHPIKSRKVRGLSLIEALLFLGIAAVVAIGVFSYYNTASNTTKMNSAQTQIQALVGGVKTLYSSQTNFTSLTEPLIIQAGKAPDNAVDGNSLINPWGGNINVAGSARFFELTYQGIPRDACTGILAAGMLDNGSLIQMSANSTTFVANPDPAASFAACTSATNNTLVFRAR